VIRTTRTLHRRFSTCLMSAAAVSALMAPLAAHAQPTPQPSDTAGEATQELTEVVVTGSRLQSGFTAPTPVTVASAEQLREAAPTNIADGLNQLPVFNGSLKTSNPGTTPGTGNSGQNLLSLRGLGANRNLVLLNGNRFVATNYTGSVDVNVIPQALVKRVEVVTGGASAAYGSDAVSGVINFVLDEEFEGIRGTVQGGVSTRGDLPSFGASVAGGKSFAGDRLHVLGAFEYFQEDGIRADKSTGRKWYDQAAGQYPVPGQPTGVTVVPDIRSSRGSYGGLITSGPLRGTTFLPGGELGVFDFGSFTSTSFQSGGDGPRINLGFAPDQSRYNGFVRLQFEASDAVQTYVEGTYAHAHTKLGAFANQHVGSANQFTIFRDNAFLPVALATRMDANRLASVVVGRFESDFPLVEIENFTNVYRVAGGFRADLGGNWKLDGSLAYGRTDLELRENNLTVNRNLYAALDSVRDASGNIVCRSTLSGLDAGCVPLNIFGVGSPSSAAIDYVIADGVAKLKLQQVVAGINIAGDLGDTFSLGAGPISVAAGAEYRKEKANQTTDAISRAITSTTGLRGAPASQNNRPGGFNLYNPLPFNGSYNIKEAYLEVGLPVLKDSPLGKALNVNGAVRYEDYSASGGVTTWKVGGDYEPIEGLRLRVTRSRDIRGPSLVELYDPGRQATLNSVYQGQTLQTRFFTSGNPNLLPERADTLTFGAVIRPAFLPGFQFSADRYEIEIKDAIDFLLPQQEIDLCAAGNQSFCSLITRNPDNTLTVIGPNLNLSVLKAAGIDFEAVYSRPVGEGTLTLRGLANHRTSFYVTPLGSAPIHSLGEPSTPKWSANFQVRYETERWALFLQERFISRSKFNADRVEGVDTNLNHAEAVWYTDATFTYNFDVFGQQQQAFFSVSNLFDRDPPVATSDPSSFSVPTSSAYDPRGRYFNAGLRFRY